MTPPKTPTHNTLMPYQARSHLKHGHTKGRKYSPTYHSWQSMLTRCRYIGRDTEKKYIGRGISFDPRWEDFDNFLADMGERPKGTTLDRFDNEKGYNKDNCRWATPIEQARNRRNKKLEYMDAFTICCRMISGYSAKDISEEFGCSESLPREIYRGRTWKDAHKSAFDFMGVKNGKA